jgi:hypothetical protein
MWQTLSIILIAIAAVLVVGVAVVAPSQACSEVISPPSDSGAQRDEEFFE